MCTHFFQWESPLGLKQLFLIWPAPVLSSNFICTVMAKQVYSEWYHTVSDDEIRNLVMYVFREMIKVKEGCATCDIFLILVI